jgi:transposase
LKLNESDVLLVFQLRRQGLTLRAIADRFGVSVPSIHAVVQGRSHRHVGPDHPDRIAVVRAEARRLARFRASRRTTRAGWGKVRRGMRLYFSGYSLRAAAKRVGIGATTLYRELLKRGIPRRKKSRRSKQFAQSAGKS